MISLDEMLARVIAASFRPAYLAALESRDDTDPVPLLQGAAENGDAHAMLILGAMLLAGRGIERNTDAGIVWIRQSAVRGESRAMFVLGEALVEGTGGPCDDAEAAYWFYRAGLAGRSEAVDHLARLLLRRPSLTGLHFSHAEFMALLSVARRPALAEPNRAAVSHGRQRAG
jgi:TPR repeat protein